MKRWRKQTKFGKKGNCMAYAIAGVFNVSIKETRPISDKVESGWAKELHEFCDRKGYSWLIVSPLFQGAMNDALYIACGTSPRSDTRRHCVVMKGDKMYWDPHPSSKGLKDIDSIWVFIPKDIAKTQKALS